MQNTENEEFVQCPFVASHLILKQHFAVHLVRCKRQHVDVQLVACPFNATHLIANENLEEHKEACPNRTALETFQRRRDEPPATNSRPQPPQPVMLQSSDIWSDDEGTYDPAAYAASAPVLRMMKGGSKSEKRRFRAEERDRWLKIKNMNIQEKPESK